MRSNTRRILTTAAPMALYAVLVLATVAMESRVPGGQPAHVADAHAAESADGMLVLRMADAAGSIIRGRLLPDAGSRGGTR